MRAAGFTEIRGGHRDSRGEIRGGHTLYLRGSWRWGGPKTRLRAKFVGANMVPTSPVGTALPSKTGGTNGHSSIGCRLAPTPTSRHARGGDSEIHYRRSTKTKIPITRTFRFIRPITPPSLRTAAHAVWQSRQDIKRCWMIGGQNVGGIRV